MTMVLRIGLSHSCVIARGRFAGAFAA